MNKQALYFSILSLTCASHVYALQTGDLLTITPGAGVMDSSGYTQITSGSYFAMDLNGNGKFSTSERTGISPGAQGGLIIGALQPAAGSHSGYPNGTETAPIDAPWSFFANTGMHQTLSTPVTINADGTLDFSGWSVTWNGITEIPFSAPFWNYPNVGVIACDTPACSFGENYVLNFYGSVPPGDPSGFGGVGYQLHLEGAIGIAAPFLGITLNVNGGAIQECNSTNGNTVSISSTVNIPDDDSVASIQWTVDGTPAGSGNTINPFLTLGSHNVAASLTTTNGGHTSALTTVRVRDTTPPVVSANFIDLLGSTTLANFLQLSYVEIDAAATDICDPAPVVHAMIGAAVDDGSRIRVTHNRGRISMSLDSLDLDVRASDSSNNHSSATATLQISK